MTETEHNWVRTNIATYLASGLGGEERARFEAHLGACGACLEDLNDAQATEGTLNELFKNSRPRSGIEDRIIQGLRTAPEPARLRNPIWFGIAKVAAAAILLGALGIMVDQAQVEKSTSEVGPGFVARERSDSSVNALAARKSNEMLGRRGLAGGERTRDMFERKGFAQDAAGAPSEDPAIFSSSAENSESDHNESADSEDYRRSKGDDMQNKAKEGGVYDRMGGGGAGGRFGGKPSPDSAFKSEANAPGMAAPPPSAPKTGEYYRPESEKRALESLDKAKDPAPTKKDANYEDKKGKTPPPVNTIQEQEKANRKIIRQGEMEFEVENFENSVASISKIVAEETGFVGTVSSDRLPNGKVRGTIVVRVPPDRLDTLILKLRALGELKSQRLTSEDVTKKYTDSESRLRAARAMEARLLEIIKSGKGEIKEILEAEKQLGDWREKIEVLEGELRYYTNQVALSTLTITLSEKDIRTPSGVIETERVTMSLQVEDVEKAYKDALQAVADAKGRVTNSALQKHDAGQFSATVYFEIAPDSSNALRDRISQFGRVAHLDIKRDQQLEDGRGGQRTPDVKVKRNDSVCFLSIYNLVNVQPRETATCSIACNDVEASYKAILARIKAASGRIITSQLNRQKADQTTGTLYFEIPAKDADAVQADVRAHGEVTQFVVTENQDVNNVTTSKKGFQVTLFGMSQVVSRETVTITIIVPDVAKAYADLQKLVTEAKGRFLAAQLLENDRHDKTGKLYFDLPAKEIAALETAIVAAGEVMTRNVKRAEGGNVVDSKSTFSMMLMSAATIEPRIRHQMGIEVKDVDKVLAAIKAEVLSANGHIGKDDIARPLDGKVSATLHFEVPLAALKALVEKVRGTGEVRFDEAYRNEKALEGRMAKGRVEVTLSTPGALLGPDDGFMAQLKKGLTSALGAAAFSLRALLIGMLVVVPWALIIYGLIRLARKFKAKPAAPAVPAA